MRKGRRSNNFTEEVCVICGNKFNKYKKGRGVRSRVKNMSLKTSNAKTCSLKCSSINREITKRGIRK